MRTAFVSLLLAFSALLTTLAAWHGVSLLQEPDGTTVGVAYLLLVATGLLLSLSLLSALRRRTWPDARHMLIVIVFTVVVQVLFMRN